MSSRSSRTRGGSKGTTTSGHSRDSRDSRSSSNSSKGSRSSGNDWRTNPECPYCHGNSQGTYMKLGPYEKDYKCGSCFGHKYYTGEGGAQKNCVPCGGKGYILKNVIGWHPVVCDCWGYY